MREVVRSICIAGFLALPMACAPATVTEEQGETLARERWEARAVDTYRFDYQMSCFCVVDQVQPVTIDVRDGRVVRVVARESGERIEDPRLEWLTIEGLFKKVREMRQSGTEPLVVRYHPELGYPTYVEAGTLANDAGVIYTASDLRPLE